MSRSARSLVKKDSKCSDLPANPMENLKIKSKSNQRGRVNKERRGNRRKEQRKVQGVEVGCEEAAGSLYMHDHASHRSVAVAVPQDQLVDVGLQKLVRRRYCGSFMENTHTRPRRSWR